MYNSNTNDNNNDNIFGEDAGAGVCRLRRGARARRLRVDRVIKVYGRKKYGKKGHCFAFSEREIITLEPSPANGLYAADDVTAPASVRWSAQENVAGRGASVMVREWVSEWVCDRVGIWGRKGSAGRPRRISELVRKGYALFFFVSSSASARKKININKTVYSSE